METARFPNCVSHAAGARKLNGGEGDLVPGLALVARVAHLVEELGQNDGLVRLQGLHSVLPREEPQQMAKGATHGLQHTGGHSVHVAQGPWSVCLPACDRDNLLLNWLATVVACGTRSWDRTLSPAMCL